MSQGRDTDSSEGPITVTQEPLTQTVKEGSKVELVFKCKARGNSELTYQWFNYCRELPGRNASTLSLKHVKLRDFGRYRCVARCKDSSSFSVDSSPAELDVTPRDGTTYKCLKDIDHNTLDRIGDLLTLKSCGSGGWRQIAAKYHLDELKIKTLENDPKAHPGKSTLDYLGTSNPDLTVYNFCKKLKEPDIKRLDIVQELLEHLSVPSSSTAYL